MFILYVYNDDLFALCVYGGKWRALLFVYIFKFNHIQAQTKTNIDSETGGRLKWEKTTCFENNIMELSCLLWIHLFYCVYWINLCLLWANKFTMSPILRLSCFQSLQCEFFIYFLCLFIRYQYSKTVIFNITKISQKPIYRYIYRNTVLNTSKTKNDNT